MKNYYDILNIKSNATESEIKQQWRKLSLKYHPDKNNGHDEKFKEITEAYEILKDNDKRQEYDFQLNFTNNPFNNESNSDPLSSIFNMFLNPRNLRQHNINRREDLFSNLSAEPKIHIYRGNLNHPLNDILHSGFPHEFTRESVSEEENIEPIDVKLKLTLKQVYFGCNVPIEIKRTIKKNNKIYSEKETIYVDIEKGVDNNEKITIENKGNIINNKSGNINVFIIVDNNTPFIRNGLDLIYNKNITFKESLCGFSFNIKYIDNREFKINSKSGDIISNNQEKIIPNLGIKRNNKTGSLIIKFNVDECVLTEEQLKTIQNIL